MNPGSVPDRVALFSTMAWYLWQFCNRLREHQSVCPLHELGDRARGLVDEFWEVNPQVQSEPVRRLVMRWSPPPHDHYKVNFGATFFEETGAAGVGVVVHDCARQIIGALRQNIGLV